MPAPEITFIVNPHAGNGSTGRKWPHIRAAVERRLGEVAFRITRGPGEAERFSRKAVIEGSRRVVGVGGDGTLNEIINGIMQVRTRHRSKVAVGFIPNGTGCDIARTLAIPKNIEQAADIIATADARKMDLGRIKFVDHNGNPFVRYFHNMISLGVGGEVVERVNRMRKPFGPLMSFLFATLFTVLRYQGKNVRLTFEGKAIHPFPVWNVAVANGRYQGAGMQMAPDASVTDGLLNVTMIGTLTLPAVLRYLPLLYTGRIYDVPVVSVRRCRQFTAESGDRVMIDVDGEQPGTLPVSVDILPAALHIISRTLQ